MTDNMVEMLKITKRVIVFENKLSQPAKNCGKTVKTIVDKYFKFHFL